MRESEKNFTLLYKSGKCDAKSQKYSYHEACQQVCYYWSHRGCYTVVGLCSCSDFSLHCNLSMQEEKETTVERYTLCPTICIVVRYLSSWEQQNEEELLTYTCTGKQPTHSCATEMISCSDVYSMQTITSWGS